jgi:soluble lytic murein transglycosylase
MLAIMAASSPALAGEPVKTEKVRIATADGAQTAAILPGSNREARIAPLPKPLSASDAALYKKVMELQASGQLAAADRELGKIRDDLLKGHVLASRLLAPGAKPKYAEIRAWLSEYADLPQAEAIHRLSKGIKASKGTGALRAPAKGSLRGTGIEFEADGATWEEAAYDVEASPAKVKTFKAKLRQLLRDEEPARVEALMASAEAQAMAPLDFDRMRLMVAADHFAGGRDEPAAALASLSAERSGEQLPAAHWITGLAQWRLDKPDLARRHFEEVAKSAESQDWLSAAGAFWAARANLVSRRPEAVNHWLELAATSSRTYYGLLARAALGHETQFSWEVPPFTEGDADLLMRIPAARRALGLLQLDDSTAAEAELRKLYPNAGKGVRHSMLVLAYAGKMPALAVSMGGSLPRENGRVHDAAAFPVPDWSPKGGWKIDKALVFALVRQESSFNPTARSGAGATGLMQLMPATAAAIGGRGARERLLEPEHNLALGQRYVGKLLAEEPVNGNLLMMAAAYNAGPGNLGRWLSGMRHNDDPLLLVEGIPSRQTRAFVQRVMTNYWIYQNRLGQQTDTLEAVASGEWPLYSGQDPLDAKPRR